MNASILCAAAAVGLAGPAWASLPSTCPWDCALPHDKVINTIDFLALLNQWGTAGNCNFNGGVINASDFLAMLQHWGPCPIPTNDDCSFATAIDRTDPASDTFVEFDLYGATRSGDPLHCLDGIAGCPSGGGCCESSGGTGCNDANCCGQVCATDPFCCDVAWDSICAGEAQDLCPVCQKDLWYCLNNQTGAFETITVSSSVNLFIEVRDGCVCGEGKIVGCGQGTTHSFLMLPGSSVSIRLVNSLQLPNDQLQGIMTIANAFGCPTANDCCISGGGIGCADADCCTRVCIIDPFCCDVGWDSICLFEAVNAPECPCCPCGAGNVGEDEVCGEDNNGGCNSQPQAYTAVSCGDAVCGTAWAEGGTRDTDWYLVDVPDPDSDGFEVLRARLKSQFSGVCFIIDVSDCANPSILATGFSDDCTPGGDAVACVQAPSVYAVFAGTIDFDGTPCNSGDNNYTVEISCEPCICGFPDAGPCCAAHGGSGCSNVECCDAVCAIDPFCCNVNWDVICANEAQLFDACGCVAAAQPGSRSGG